MRPRRSVHRDYIAPKDMPSPARIATAYRLLHAIERRTRKHGCQGDIKHTGFSVFRELVRLWCNFGRCIPAHQTIADSAGCCEKTVRRALAAMERAGIIEWCHRRWKERDPETGRWRVYQTSNAYRLTVEAPTPAWLSSDGKSDRLPVSEEHSSGCTKAVAASPRGQSRAGPAYITGAALLAIRRAHGVGV